MCVGLQGFHLPVRSFEPCQFIALLWLSRLMFALFANSASETDTHRVHIVGNCVSTSCSSCYWRHFQHPINESASQSRYVKWNNNCEKLERLGLRYETKHL